MRKAKLPVIGYEVGHRERPDPFDPPRENSNEWKGIQRVSSQLDSLIITGLLNGQAYLVSVRTLVDGGMSAWSSPVLGIPVIPASGPVFIGGGGGGGTPPPPPPPPPSDSRLTRIELPEGFHIRVYAEGVTGARSMSLGSDGTLFVGTRPSGRVYAPRDEDGDHKAERVITLASGLNNPNGAPSRTATCTSRKSAASCAIATSKQTSTTRRSRRSSTTLSPRIPVMAGSSSALAPTVCCTCRSARRATSAIPAIRTHRSEGWTPMVPSVS